MSLLLEDTAVDGRVEPPNTFLEYLYNNLGTPSSLLGRMFNLVPGHIALGMVPRLFRAPLDDLGGLGDVEMFEHGLDEWQTHGAIVDGNVIN